MHEILAQLRGFTGLAVLTGYPGKSTITLTLAQEEGLTIHHLDHWKFYTLTALRRLRDTASKGRMLMLWQGAIPAHMSKESLGEAAKAAGVLLLVHENTANDRPLSVALYPRAAGPSPVDKVSEVLKFMELQPVQFSVQIEGPLGVTLMVVTELSTELLEVLEACVPCQCIDDCAAKSRWAQVKAALGEIAIDRLNKAMVVSYIELTRIRRKIAQVVRQLRATQEDTEEAAALNERLDRLIIAQAQEEARIEGGKWIHNCLLTKGLPLPSWADVREHIRSNGGES